MNPPKAQPDWGLLPEAVHNHLVNHEWTNRRHLKARLLGTRPFPIIISLKPPEGRSAISNLAHFQHFIQAWKNYPHPHRIQWETRNYRTLAQQHVPRYFMLNTIEALIDCVGQEAKNLSVLWQRNMAPLLALDEIRLYPILIKHLEVIETMPSDACLLLKEALTQLTPNMGKRLYLRALPLVGVDTKFVETYQSLITDILDILHEGALTDAGGLLPWLGCLSTPKGWLWVRPLCPITQAAMGHLPIMQLPYELLQQQALPAVNILVVENMQSGLGLPALNHTIAVFGGGKNIAWLDAAWLQTKRVAYWGDIDTWGLTILAEVRNKLASVTPLMMDHTTVQTFETRMVVEEKPVEQCPLALTEGEQTLFHNLKSGVYQGSRLEQERLSMDYIRSHLERWLAEL